MGFFFVCVTMQVWVVSEWVVLTVTTDPHRKLNCFQEGSSLPSTVNLIILLNAFPMTTANLWLTYVIYHHRTTTLWALCLTDCEEEVKWRDMHDLEMSLYSSSSFYIILGVFFWLCDLLFGLDTEISSPPKVDTFNQFFVCNVLINSFQIYSII